MSNAFEKEERWKAFVEEEWERASEAAAERWLGFEEAEKWRVRKIGQGSREGKWREVESVRGGREVESVRGGREVDHVCGGRARESDWGGGREVAAERWRQRGG